MIAYNLKKFEVEGQRQRSYELENLFLNIPNNLQKYLY